MPSKVLLAGLVLQTIDLLGLKVETARGLVVNHANIFCFLGVSPLLCINREIVAGKKGSRGD